MKPTTNVKQASRAGLAWAVHLFTASGIVLGFLALVAVWHGNITLAFLWLGLALFVDGIDGSLARKARVEEFTPNVDGRTLDNVIDYFNYVAVPAIMIYWFEMVPGSMGVIAAAGIMAVSCYTFANVGMKTDDYYFVGFPAVWNVVVLYFHILQTGPVTNLLVIAALGVLTFIPMKFVHPLRVKFMAEITVPMTILWAVTTFILVLGQHVGVDAGAYRGPLMWLWIASSIYFAGICIWRSLKKS